MALEHNPAKAKTMTEKWLRDINRRWKEFTDKAVSELKSNNKMATNAKEIFEMDQSEIRVYMVFFQGLIDEILMGTTDAPNWQAQHQLTAYLRNMERARAQLISQGLDLIPSAQEAELASTLSIQQFTAIPSLGVGAATASLAPIHSEALQFLYTRSYEKLNGWTSAMASETRQILTDAVGQGKGITEVTKQIVDRVNVSRSRAQVVARTEIIQALQRSTINETDRASEEIGEEMLITWQSALLVGRTRELHWKWHGDVITTKEANRRIGVSPWNCVCNLIATVPETVTPKRTARFAEQKKQFEKMDDSKSQLKVNSIMMQL